MNEKRTFTRSWLKATLIRALRTFAQAAIAAIGTSAVTIAEVNWVGVGSTAALAAALSILTSIAAPPPEAQTGEQQK